MGSMPPDSPELTPEQQAEIDRIERFNEDPDFVKFEQRQTTAESIRKLAELLLPISELSEVLISKETNSTVRDDLAKRAVAHLDKSLAAGLEEIKAIVATQDEETDALLAEKVLDLQDFLKKARKDLSERQDKTDKKQDAAIKKLDKALGNVEKTLDRLSKELDERVHEIAVTAINLLEGYEGDQRLDASAIKNLPEPKEETGASIVEKINSLEIKEELQIDSSHIKNLPEFVKKEVGKGGATIARWGRIRGNLPDQEDLQTELDTKIVGVNTHKITVSPTAPSDPALNDLWVDTS